MRRINSNFIILILTVATVSLLGKNYKGAEYRTIEDYLYGRFEVNYKAPSQDGVLASFFTYFNGNDSIPWTAAKWNEIDIEIMGRYNNSVQFNVITLGQTNHVRSNFVNFDPTKEFHTYAFEWTPDYVSWFIDDEEVYKQTASHIPSLIYAQKIMMNIWNPEYTNWAGVFVPAALPAFAYYDWVKYYSYTPGSGNYGSDNNFTHQWTDEFDSFDETRWSKATHTFQGNGCDFITDNVVFENGKLILCLTDATNTGFVDKTPPTILGIRALVNKLDVYFSEGIDKSSAEDKSNYTIVGITIDQVRLLENGKTVQLFVSDLDSTKSYNLIALNIKDTATTPNNMAGKVIAFTVSNPLQFPVKINVGGEPESDFIGDEEWKINSEYGYTEGNISEYSIGSLTPIYRSERYGLVSYKIRVPNGSYNVKLMFAEKYYSTVGKRKFDIYAEGNLIRNNFDILSLVIKDRPYNIDIIDLEVNDEILELNFCAEIDVAILSGIELDQITTDISDKNNKEILKFNLNQNYPNPFNPNTIINYTIPKVLGNKFSSSINVELKIYDSLGREVATLVNEIKPPGNYETNFNASQYSSGVYYYQLKAGDFVQSKKMVLLK